MMADNIKELFSKAKKYILANPEKLQQWDTKDYKMPGGNANDPKIDQMLSIAPAMLNKKTNGIILHQRLSSRLQLKVQLLILILRAKLNLDILWN